MYILWTRTITLYRSFDTPVLTERLNGTATWHEAATLLVTDFESRARRGLSPEVLPLDITWWETDHVRARLHSADLDADGRFDAGHLKFSTHSADSIGREYYGLLHSDFATRSVLSDCAARVPVAGADEMRSLQPRSVYIVWTPVSRD